MIDRILVPKGAKLPNDAAAEPGRRRFTELDTRTVVAAGLPAVQIDPHSKIPAYMPLDVIPARMIIPRDMPVAQLDVTQTVSKYVPLDVLARRSRCRRMRSCRSLRRSRIRCGEHTTCLTYWTRT